MISKIVWPRNNNKGNPFGGVNGFRPIRITFHSSSFVNIQDNEKKALDILTGLAGLDNVDAMSFDGFLFPKIVIDSQITNDNFFALQVFSPEGKLQHYSGIPKSWVDPKHMSYLHGMKNIKDEGIIQLIRQEILEARSHYVLKRDIFVTTSDFLLTNKYEDVNIYYPSEALKIIGLYLRINGEFEWTLRKESNSTETISRYFFYQWLSKGLLPNSRKYLSKLSLHRDHEELIEMGWSAMEKYSRALQARDEIGRLFYLPETTGVDDKMLYHFEYLTILLTAILDTQALIINKVYSLGLKDSNCGFRRSAFTKAIKNNPDTKNISKLLNDNLDFIFCLFTLRNKIHSISLEKSTYSPITSPDDLLEKFYQYDPKDHFGIQRTRVSYIKNNSEPTPKYYYSVDKYNMALSLLQKTTEIINPIMEETKIENYLPTNDLSKIKTSQPDNDLPYIQICMLLG